MRLDHLLANVRLQFFQLARMPAFAVPTLALPLITYLMFGLPQVQGRTPYANGVMVGFAAFALLGIVMFQFGVGIAAERDSPWERYVRSLPSGGLERFVARLIVAVTFGVAAVTPVFVCASLFTPVELSAAAWLRILVSLAMGSVTLGLLGIMLGYLISGRGALPVTNLIYLPLAYAGGLFTTRAQDLPHAIATVSPWLPTRQWGDLLIDFGLGGHLPGRQLLCLVGYAALFATAAVLGYRRDEEQHYS